MQLVLLLAQSYIESCPSTHFVRTLLALGSHHSVDLGSKVLCRAFSSCASSAGMEGMLTEIISGASLFEAIGLARS
jgi:hypothetical protein